MMLRMNTDGSDYGSWEGGSYLHDEEEDEDEDDEEEEEDDEHDHFDGTDIDDEEVDDAFDVHAHDIEDDDDDQEEDDHVVEYDTDAFSSDEAYARALQDAEEREMAARLLALAGINERQFI